MEAHLINVDINENPKLIVSSKKIMTVNNSFIKINEGINLEVCSDKSGFVTINKKDLNGMIMVQKQLEAEIKELKKQKEISDSYEEFSKTKYNNLSNIINNLELPIIRLSYPNFNILELNTKAFNCLSDMDNSLKVVNEELLIGESIIDLIPAFKLVIDEYSLEEFDKVNEIKFINNIMIKMAGVSEYFNIIFQPCSNSKGKVVELLIIGIDVTTEVETKLSMEKC